MSGGDGGSRMGLGGQGLPHSLLNSGFMGSLGGNIQTSMGNSLQNKPGLVPSLGMGGVGGVSGVGGSGLGGGLMGGLGGGLGGVPGFPGSSAQSPAGQRLKVEDALSYLDQVKIQFQNRPQVYSDFLDIMKDFKSQAIDTPGVIGRVSSLFVGHPRLIVGFNTFLPLGYKIQVDGEHGERVSISTPNGQSHVISQGGQVAREGESGLGTLDAAASAAAPDSSAQPLSTAAADLAAQQPPLEFNHAISYVNKIKSRFHHKPHVYKQFLEILHTYQKEQKDLSQGNLSQKTKTESQVFDCVAKLFAEEKDLLKEFSQFLPDAGSMSLGGVPGALGAVGAAVAAETSLPSTSAAAATGTKRPPSSGPRAKLKTEAAEPSPKRAKPTPQPQPVLYDTPTSEAAKHCTLEELQFFDKVRKGFRSDTVYENFLRLLVLFNLELISKTELLQLSYPFLGKFPELMKWLTEFLGCSCVGEAGEAEGISSDLALEIDYASCKRLGVSYRALPPSYAQPKASGRTGLCDEVLNDTWVSFPSWSSEDSSCVSSKKSLYEEHIYKTEDERFELDIVLELNRSAMETLEGLSRGLGALGEAEARQRTEDAVSPPLIQRAVRRIYGERAGDILQGLRRNPQVAVPLVLSRLAAKEEEWRDAQKGFNRLWREQNDKYYLKSLDQQSLSFKQNDLKALKSKALINQIEVLYDERQEKAEENGMELSGPHMTLQYPARRAVIGDVTDLLIHHVKRQSQIQKEDKLKMKKFLKVTVADIVGLERGELSDDEEDGEGEGDEEEGEDGGVERRTRRVRGRGVQPQTSTEVPSLSAPPASRPGYSLIFLPNSVYVFFRLHALLSQRLAQLLEHAESLAAQSAPPKPNSAAALLKALPVQTTPPSQFYAQLLLQVKNLLDGAVDAAAYEDSLREMFTTQAYVAFTMDKMVQTMVRQLTSMCSEAATTAALALYDKWAAEGGAGGPGFVSAARQEKEEAYQAAAEALMTDQNCFKCVFSEESGSLGMELLDTDSASEENRDEWASYLASAVSASASQRKEVMEELKRKPVLLYRHLRRRAEEGRSEEAEAEVLCLEGLEKLWRGGRVGGAWVRETADVWCRRGALGRARAAAGSRRKAARLRDLTAVFLRQKGEGSGAASPDPDELDGQCRQWLEQDASLAPQQVLHPDFPHLTANKYSTNQSN